MRSEYLSILPASSPASMPASMPKSSDGNSTANEVANSDGDSLSYSARYQAFLDQQSQKNPRMTYGLSGLASIVRGVVNLAVFIVFFLTILTLFGFGLLRLGVVAQGSPSDVSASRKKVVAGGADSTPSPASPQKSRRAR